MVGMTVEQIGIYTVADLEGERDRDDRLRWELLEGELVMTPAPRMEHQHIQMRLAARLLAVVDDSLNVIGAPFDVRLSDETVLQPDILVAPYRRFDQSVLSGPPLLAVEILSPSTRRRDLMTKLDILQRAGCPHYWVIDPDDTSARIWDLVDGAYVLTQHVTGDEPVRVTHPVELTFRVSELMSPTS